MYAPLLKHLKTPRQFCLSPKSWHSVKYTPIHRNSILRLLHPAPGGGWPVFLVQRWVQRRL